MGLYQFSRRRKESVYEFPKKNYLFGPIVTKKLLLFIKSLCPFDLLIESGAKTPISQHHLEVLDPKIWFNSTSVLLCWRSSSSRQKLLSGKIKDLSVNFSAISETKKSSVLSQLATQLTLYSSSKSNQGEFKVSILDTLNFWMLSCYSNNLHIFFVVLKFLFLSWRLSISRYFP